MSYVVAVSHVFRGLNLPRHILPALSNVYPQRSRATTADL